MWEISLKILREMVSSDVKHMQFVVNGLKYANYSDDFTSITTAATL